MRSSVHSTPPIPALQTPTPVDAVDFLKRREKLFKEIEKNYGKDKDGKPGQASYIKRKLDDKWAESGSPSESLALLEMIEKNLEQHKTALEEHTNVIRQKAEVEKANKNPGEIDMAAVGREIEFKMGIGKKYWHSYHETFGAQFYSDHEKKEDILQKIKKHKDPVIHTKPNSRKTKWFMPIFNNRKLTDPKMLLPQEIAGYSRLLHEAEAETSRALLDNTLDLQSILETGKPHPPSKKMPFQAGFDALGEIAKLAVVGSGTVVDKLGKGIVSHSKPEENPNYKKYLKYRDAIVSDLLWKFNPDGSRHGRLMQQYAEILKNNLDKNGLLDENSFQELMKIVEEEAKAANAGHEEQIKKMNETINDLNKKMYEDVKEHTKSEDDMFKYRAFQVFLIAAPFAGIMYLGPVLGAFSSVFQNADGIGEGIASLCTPEQTGIFGTVAQALRIDDLIRWLLTDLPVVSDVMNLTDYVIGGSIVQTALGGAVLPVLAGPLVPIAIAGLTSIYSVGRMADDYQKWYDSDTGKFPKHKKDLDEAIKKLRDELQDPDEIRSKKSKKEAEELIDKTVDANLDKPKRDELKRLLNFSSNMSETQIAQARKALEEKLKSLGLKEKDAQNKLQFGIMNIFDTFHAGPNLEGFYDKKFKILESAHSTEFLLRFLMSAAETECTQQGKFETGLLGKLFANDKILSVLKTCVVQGEFSEDALSKILVNADNKEIREQLERRVLYFISTADQNKSFDQMVQETNDAFNAAKTDRVALKKLEDALKNEQQHRKQEFILGIAQDRDISYDKNIETMIFNDPQRMKEITRLQELIKQKEISDMKEIISKNNGFALGDNATKIAKTMMPGTVPAMVKGVPMFTNQIAKAA